MNNPILDDKSETDYREVRSGGWGDYAQYVRVSKRDYDMNTERFYLGFRVVRNKQ